MTIGRAKAMRLRVWCGTEGAGEFVDHFLDALFADRSSEARQFLDPDLGRRSYGHIREALSFLEGERWMYIPTTGTTPDGMEIVRFLHLNDPALSAQNGRPLVSEIVDLEIRNDGTRSIVRIGPKKWEQPGLTP